MLCKDTAAAAQDSTQLQSESKNQSYNIVEDLFSFDDKEVDLLGDETESGEFQKNDVDSWILQSIAEASPVDKPQINQQIGQILDQAREDQEQEMLQTLNEIIKLIKVQKFNAAGQKQNILVSGEHSLDESQ